MIKNDVVKLFLFPVYHIALILGYVLEALFHQFTCLLQILTEMVEDVKEMVEEDASLADILDNVRPQRRTSKQIFTVEQPKRNN